MDCHAAPGACSEWPGIAVLHGPGTRAHFAGLLVRGPGCDRSADSGLLDGARGHAGRRRDAAVVTALCALAGWGSLVPPRARRRAPDSTGVLECLPGDGTTDGFHPAVAALLHDLPVKRPDHRYCGANLGRRRLVGLRGPQV